MSIFTEKKDPLTRRALKAYDLLFHRLSVVMGG